MTPKRPGTLTRDAFSPICNSRTMLADIQLQIHVISRARHNPSVTMRTLTDRAYDLEVLVARLQQGDRIKLLALKRILFWLVVAMVTWWTPGIIPAFPAPWNHGRLRYPSNMVDLQVSDAGLLPGARMEPLSCGAGFVFLTGAGYGISDVCTRCRLRIACGVSGGRRDIE